MSELTPGPDETLDVLSRSLRILQRRKGHRATSDDVLLAGVAAEAAPGAQRVLDLGTGKGTVALLLARALPHSTLVGVEAFPQSHALAVRNAALNGLQGRYTPRLGDLRDEAVLADCAPFDLVCGAPPFMPLGSGVLPADPQRAAGRFELRGGVEAYAATAARHLAPGGRVVLLMDTHGGARLDRALAGQGLAVVHRLSVHPRPDAPPTFHVAVAGWAGAGGVFARVSMRAATGERWSAWYQSLRDRLDLP